MRTIPRLRLTAFLTVLVALLTFFDCASAYIPCYCNNPLDQCTCFIQLGDTGFAVKQIIKVLRRKGYLGKLKRQDEFTAEVRDAVIAFQTDQGLTCTGWMDDETLNALLSDQLPEVMVQYTENQWLDIVFIPTDGGKRYHLDPTCCDMYHPRLISRTNAERLGIQRCGLENERSTSSLGQVLSTRALNRASGVDYSASALAVYTALDIKPRLLPDDYYLEEEETNTFMMAEGLDLPGDTAGVRSLPTDGAETIYIGNRNSHVFHLESCGSVKNMSEKNKVVFLTRDEAIEEGYEPCGRCNP